MIELKNISNQFLTLYLNRQGDVISIDLQPGETQEFENLNDFINLYYLLDPSLNLILIKDVN